MKSLERRLDALDGGKADHKPWCLVIVDDDALDNDTAVARHVTAGECKPDSGGHIIVRFVDPPGSGCSRSPERDAVPVARGAVAR